MKVPSKSRLRKQYNNKKKTQTKKQTNQKNPTKQKSAPVTTKFQNTKSTHLLSLLPIHLGGLLQLYRKQHSCCWLDYALAEDPSSRLF